MAPTPDRVPRDIVHTEVPDLPPDDLIPPDLPGDSGEGWDPVGLAMLARWLARSYLRAQDDPGPDE